MSFHQPPTVWLSTGLLDQIGPALISGRPIFIYGPTGNGKTSITERFPRVYNDSILVPYAVEVDAHVISVYDPLVHRPVEVDLDRSWDLLRQRRALRAAGVDPDRASARDADTVEDYLQ